MLKKTFLNRGILNLAIWSMLAGLLVTAPAQSQDAAKGSKTLVIAQAGDVSSVDEHQLAGVAKNALIQIYDWQWVRYRTMTLSNGTLVVNPREMAPGIITSWKTEKQANGTAAHRLQIRKGAVHHSGNPVTAEDFKYAILRNAALGRNSGMMLLGKDQLGGRRSLTRMSDHNAYRNCGQAHLRVSRSMQPIRRINRPTCQNMDAVQSHQRRAMWFSSSTMTILPYLGLRFPKSSPALLVLGPRAAFPRPGDGPAARWPRRKPGPAGTERH